jgi:hypothetical protein
MKLYFEDKEVSWARMEEVLSQPKPLDVMCIHYYGNLKGEFPPETKPAHVGGLSTRGLELLSVQARAVSDSGSPLFVGRGHFHAECHGVVLKTPSSVSSKSIRTWRSVFGSRT